MKSRHVCRGLVAAGVAFGLCSIASAAGRVVNLSAVERGAPYDGFIVKFAGGSVPYRQASAVAQVLVQATSALQQAGQMSTGAWSLTHARRLGIGADVVSVSRRLSVAEARAAMKQLAAMPGVEYVEPDLRLTHRFTPDDTFYNNQWGYHSAVAGIQAPLAWDVATGAGITVAVLDTGMTAHSDLAANVVAGYDFVSGAPYANDGGGRDADASDPGDWITLAERNQVGGPFQGCTVTNSTWHGTHVAGTVAAVTNNAFGVAGTAFDAKVMPVRVLGKCGGSTSDIADAVTWASGGVVTGVPTLTPAARAQVLNMSLGGTGSCSSTLQAALSGAIGRGATVVVSAGNSNLDAANQMPANCLGVVVVAATDSTGTKASFSNYGRTVTLSAPGVSILSTLNTGTTVPAAEAYAYYNGTSMAAPHVAGVVALMQSRRLALALSPMWVPAVKTALAATAMPLPGACTGGCGAGIAQAPGAITEAANFNGAARVSPVTHLLLN